ncbi:MAG: RimK family protein [Spirochaetales bacterium]|nr:RimK family protein [Spirochaetales bacterium]
MKKIIVVNDPKAFSLDIPDAKLISSKEYLSNRDYFKMKNIRLFNLSGSYAYQSKGYYVSLLAEARGHKPIPSVKNIRDVKNPSFAKFISEELDDMIQRNLAKIKSKEFVLSVYFGKNLAKQYDNLCHELYNLFPFPFFQMKFVYSKKWSITSMKLLNYKDIAEKHLYYVNEFALQYFGKKRYTTKKVNPTYYDFAMLWDPHEKYPPSSEPALKKFEEAAQSLHIYVDRITRSDLSRLSEYDALFIRETTAVNNHTYQFARKAQLENIPCFDDVDSILKCCNKVYLQEVLENARIRTPQTFILSGRSDIRKLENMAFPIVLKLPDSSFSKGVLLVNNEDELREELNTMFNQSELVLAQEFIPSEFDWRIGILDNQPLFACKYFMAKDHWQIYNWSCESDQDKEGLYESIPIGAVDEAVIKTACKAANLIGNGLYGVDLKQIKDQVYVIEINDNPNLDSGVEDGIIGDDLYLQILLKLKFKIENKLVN